MSCETCCQTPTTSVEILPDRGGAERQAEMKARRLHRRRSQKDRIGAMMHRAHLHDRGRPSCGGIISGELAERTFGHALAHRQEMAFEYDLSVRRNR